MFHLTQHSLTTANKQDFTPTPSYCSSPSRKDITMLHKKIKLTNQINEKNKPHYSNCVQYWRSCHWQSLLKQLFSVCFLLFVIADVRYFLFCLPVSHLHYIEVVLFFLSIVWMLDYLFYDLMAIYDLMNTYI